MVHVTHASPPSSAILGIETSCDETAAAVVEPSGLVRSSVIASSQQTFQATAGVIPEQAARMQLQAILPVIDAALAQAGIPLERIDAIAVTRGPGLLGSLLVGTTVARLLRALTGRPLIGVHHTLGHLSSPWLYAPGEAAPAIRFPVLTLSVSGGHTDLWLRTGHTRGRLLGRTRDDAAGEAFDKGASLLHLPYPGGPAVAHAAETGDPKAVPFPLPLSGEDTMDFSFSGLKTALRYRIRDHAADSLPDLAASYQLALCRHLTDRVARALDRHIDCVEVHLVGGVAANRHLREELVALCRTRGIPFRTPGAPAACTDNAAMIALAGGFMATELGDAAYAPFATLPAIPLEEVVRDVGE